MTTSAVLDDLIDGLEMQSDSIFSYLDRETGEVFLISEESLSLSEAEPERFAMLPDWQKEEAELAIGIQTTDRYLELPNRFDVNEWNIMHEFSLQVKKKAPIQNNLLHAIHGNHPFRRFKDQIANHDLWEEWNRFRRQRLQGKSSVSGAKKMASSSPFAPGAIGSPLRPGNSQPLRRWRPFLPGASR